MRTRIMNQLQALAMNEGYRWKKKLFSEQGRVQLEKLALAPWASRRRQELLELLDRMNPTIAELTAAVEREARKRPEAMRLMTHPGVGPLTALGYVLIIALRRGSSAATGRSAPGLRARPASKDHRRRGTSYENSRAGVCDAIPLERTARRKYLAQRSFSNKLGVGRLSAAG
jgi:transposase